MLAEKYIGMCPNPALWLLAVSFLVGGGGSDLRDT